MSRSDSEPAPVAQDFQSVARSPLNICKFRVILTGCVVIESTRNTDCRGAVNG